MAISSTLLNASGIRIGSGLGAAVYSSSTGAPTVTTSGSPSAGKQCYAFNGAGSITFSTGGLIEVYMIGGGGGGAGRYGGGGGAGGVYYKDKVYVESGLAYTVIPGAGGATYYSGYLTAPYTATFNGGSSGIFSTLPIAMIGGGGAGGQQNTAGASGPCSGGGGGSSANSPGEFEAPTTNLPGLVSGYVGGHSLVTGANYIGSGGGGIGGVGGNASGTTGGAGGIGLASSITGTSVSRGGGGGGGVSTGTNGTASFGGGAGSNPGVAGTANTGGGGGGSSGATTGGGAGGSGIVIILVG